MSDQDDNDLGWNHAVNRPKTKWEARADGAVAAIKLTILGGIFLAVLIAMLS
ncbi:hypothetical protein J7394_20010 [Ruegeria sp. R13_0]|uniref:hypothetical protein n=1 Tax=Ruegeria sp. R13_0 TaxID=2821099 RepID=UPI001ADA507A|nr:hypothetical protein [Ruegeria sp. R13_0]MBO9436509.1 hypothetical protein [Ruegeria sp. R13_0]